MVGLAVDAHGDLLGLHEIADMHAIGQHGARAQPRERADLHRAFGNHAFQVAVRTHLRAGTERDIAQPHERADHHVIAQRHLAFQDHIDIQLHIATHLHAATLLHTRRVGHAHALQAQRARSA